MDDPRKKDVVIPMPDFGRERCSAHDSMSMIDWCRGHGVDDLVHGAAEGSLARVETALNDGVPVDARCWEGHTALVAAAAHRRFAVVEHLLRRGADPSAAAVMMPGHFRDTDLGAAIARNPDSAFGMGQLVTILQIDRPLHQAAVNGDVDIVDLLVDAGAEVNDLVTGRLTPLMLAAMWGHEDVVNRLLSRGANVHLFADARGPLQAGAFPGSTQGFTALAFAAMHQRLRIVHELVTSGAHVDPVLGMGARPLHVAALNGHVVMADLLIELGACVDAKMTGTRLHGERSDLRGSTPLMLAAASGHKAVVKLLLKKGARRDLVDDRGRRAASFAESGGYPALAMDLAS